MSDIDDWKEFLGRYKVPFTLAGPRKESLIQWESALEVEVPYDFNERTNGTVIGYGGFCTVIAFDGEGRFLRVAIWE